jgi:hypothetical protein
MAAPLVDRQAHRRPIVIGNRRIVKKIRPVVEAKLLFQALAGLILLLSVQFALIRVLRRLESRLKRGGKGNKGGLRGRNVPSRIILQDIVE